MKNGNRTRYIAAFVITAVVFGTALFASNYLNNQRLENVQAIEEKIATDILSLETQYELLQRSSCSDIEENTVLSRELNTLARRLAYTEEQLGTENEEVSRLKRSYSLLQIKDYLLMQEIGTKCGLDPVFILYFYSNRGDCPECRQMGQILTLLRERYPALRVYSFDYHLDLSALTTLININNIKPALPALVIENETYYGFQDLERMEAILPLTELATSSKAAEGAVQ